GPEHPSTKTTRVLLHSLTTLSGPKIQQIIREYIRVQSEPREDSAHPNHAVGASNPDANRLLRYLEATREQPVNSDSGGFRHYVPKDEMAAAISARNPIQALCGWRW